MLSEACRRPGQFQGVCKTVINLPAWTVFTTAGEHLSLQLEGFGSQQWEPEGRGSWQTLPCLVFLYSPCNSGPNDQVLISVC